jgi:hypothetical protein
VPRARDRQDAVKGAEMRLRAIYISFRLAHASGAPQVARSEAKPSEDQQAGARSEP